MKKKHSVSQADIYDTVLFLVTVYSFEHIKIVAQSAAKQGATLKDFADSLPERGKDGLLTFNDWQKDVMVENFALLQHEFLSNSLASMADHIKMLAGVLHDMIVPENYADETIH